MKLFILIMSLLLISSSCNRNEPDAVGRGRTIAEARGCVSCHSVNGSSSVGPTWKGLYGARVELHDGTSLIADDVYLRESILDPSAKTVNGFERGLMETVIKPDSLSDDEVEALVAYIQSLR